MPGNGLNCTLDCRVSTSRQLLPRPYLKWLGGKRQLLPELLQAIETAGAFDNYYEPFLGGGALYFALARSGQLSGRAYLSDVNQNLMDTYIGIRDDVDGIIRLLLKHKQKHNEEYFYKVRSQVPRKPVGRAARVIYLNRTCFNGLYRENSKGQFNAPFGRYKNPAICDEENLRAVADTLRSAELSAQSFAGALADVDVGDLVYFDPPYAPVSRTAGFTAYSKGGFGVSEQEELAHTFAALAGRGINVILSNSFTDFTRELYRDFYIYRVYANRRINSRADRRGKVTEALVTNFPIGISEAQRRCKNGSAVLVNGGTRELVKTLARQWLIENRYEDVAALIDEVTNELKAQGKRTRRNWWEILAGGANGKPRVVAGREFPVLRVAQIRQGVPVTKSAIARSRKEQPPAVKITGRWLKSKATSA